MPQTSVVKIEPSEEQEVQNEEESLFDSKKNITKITKFVLEKLGFEYNVTQRKSNPSAGSSQTNRFPQYAVLCQLIPPDVTPIRQALPGVTFRTYL